MSSSWCSIKKNGSNANAKFYKMNSLHFSLGIARISIWQRNSRSTDLSAPEPSILGLGDIFTRFFFMTWNVIENRAKLKTVSNSHSMNKLIDLKIKLENGISYVGEGYQGEQFGEGTLRNRGYNEPCTVLGNRTFSLSKFDFMWHKSIDFQRSGLTAEISLTQPA